MVDGHLFGKSYGTPHAATSEMVRELTAHGCMPVNRPGRSIREQFFGGHQRGRAPTLLTLQEAWEPYVNNPLEDTDEEVPLHC